MTIAVRPTIFAFALAAGLACGSDDGEPRYSTNPAPAGPSGTATAALAGQTYRLEASLWRDFMPGPDVGPNGRALIAVARLSTVDGSAIPASVRADSIWVIRDGGAFRTAALEEQPRSSSATSFDVVARYGPVLPPADTVGVAVLLREAGGQRVVLRITANINRTD